MGDFRVVVEGIGGHGCGREAESGKPVPRCGNEYCPDCLTAEYVQKLKKNNNIQMALMFHWPVPGAANTIRNADPGPIDDFLTGTRSGKF